ncbi:thiamine pyrophosphate-binding protein [Rhodobaculum claviforme]
MSCGEALAHLLARHGVRHVFDIPGVHNLEMYRGLHGAGLVHISPRHEQGAVFMADGSVAQIV